MSARESLEALFEAVLVRRDASAAVSDLDELEMHVRARTLREAADTLAEKYRREPNATAKDVIYDLRAMVKNG